MIRTADFPAVKEARKAATAQMEFYKAMMSTPQQPGTPPTTATVTFVLPEVQAEALAQFCKRVGWSEMRDCAIDDAEAYEIRNALDKLRNALADVGFAPR